MYIVHSICHLLISYSESNATVGLAGNTLSKPSFLEAPARLGPQLRLYKQTLVAILAL